MPYLRQQDREKFQSLVNAMHLNDIRTPGDLNYLVTHLMLAYLENTDRKYQNYNDAIGALECAKLELYRRHVAPYEDLKIDENGDVQ